MDQNVELCLKLSSRPVVASHYEPHHDLFGSLYEKAKSV